jgi:hypothetical protein
MTIPNRYPNRAAALVGLLISLAALNMLAACGDDSPVAPDVAAAPEAPVLPDPEYLNIDLSFFDEPEQKTFGRQNFYNAYLRAVIVTSVTRLVLTPPIAAFSLALHTVPTRQPDGSWIWVYTYVSGLREAQIRLRAIAQDGGTAWTLRMTVPDDGIQNALWFAGATHDAGRLGQWTFYDINAPDAPAVAFVSWHNDTVGRELRLEVLAGDAAGDVLTFVVAATHHRIDYVDADTDNVWFIRWDMADYSGSLQVPDYRNGVESCWGEDFFDVDCVD